MSGYTEGKHNDPADTHDRLVKVGTKYQATAPSVADGDNVYLLVDAAGRPLIVGAAAEDAAVLGNPLLAGGRYDAATRTLDDGDVGALALHSDGSLRVRVAPVGAGEVTSVYDRTSTSATRATVLTPTSGKKIRVVSVVIGFNSNTLTNIEVYFGTGANITTNAGKEVGYYTMDADAARAASIQSWPDGGGPIGAADDVLSVRGDGANGTTAILVIYREE